MTTLGKVIVIVVLCVLLSGCTLHFKATELELDSERQRVNAEQFYQLNSLDIGNG